MEWNVSDPDRPYFLAWVKLYNVHTFIRRSIRGKMQPGAELYYAAFCGFHGIVEHLTLKYPQYSNAKCGTAGTALHSASHAGQVQAVRSLLKCGADVDAPGHWNQSPLQLASFQGHLNVVQCLLDHGADAKFQDVNQRTPLSHAVVSGHLKIVRVLLEHRADVNSHDKEGLAPIYKVLSRSNFNGEYPQILRLLLEYGANPNAQDKQGKTPLHLASSSKFRVLSVRLRMVRILLAHGADLDAEDARGKTPMQLAVARGEVEMVQLLSEYCSK
jgi:ankyrin repeat protein